jgi:hypothetical protein
MIPTTSRLGRTLLQLKRRALAATAVAAVLGLVLAAILNPTSRGGAIAVGLSASILASLIVAAIALERNEFADGLYGLGIEQIFKNRKQDLPDELWTSLLRGARRHFRVLGMASHGYLNSDPAREETRAALNAALGRDNVEVEMLWLDPMHELANLREQEENRRGLRRDTCDSIAFFWSLRAGMAEDRATRLRLREYRSIPTCGITWADDYLVVTHYLSGELNLTAPGLMLQANPGIIRRLMGRVGDTAPEPPGLSSAYIRNYREVASDQWSKPITAERVEELSAFRDTLEGQVGKQSEAVLRHGLAPEDGVA